jgi:aldehyde:ferredoxin oxidoreductase
MENLYGYFGKQLRVSLDSKEILKENIDASILRKYLGGVGYAARVLYDEIPKGIDPLLPENKLMFITSPLTANRIPGGGSIMLCFKSPLTNVWGESRCGGDFGPNLKSAGYDALIIDEKSDHPVFLVIDDDRVFIRSARHLIGKKITEKIKIIRDELKDPKISVMCIGPVGENLIKIANVMFEGRAAGRGGVGAVMGSKNLIGIAVKGSHQTPIAQPEKLTETIKTCLKILRENDFATNLKKHGTTGDMAANDAAGDWPTKNWHSNSWGKAEQLYDQFFNKHLVKELGMLYWLPCRMW